MQKQKLCKFIVSAFMSESYKMSALFRPQRQNRMKCQRRQIKIHLNRTIIAVNHPLYTFQPESMSPVVVFTGNQSPAGIGKRISKTGVYDSDNGKRRVRLGIGVQFNKTIRNGSSPQCVVEGDSRTMPSDPHPSENQPCGCGYPCERKSAAFRIDLHNGTK